MTETVIAKQENREAIDTEQSARELAESLRPLIESIVALQEEACSIYKPEVDRACRLVLPEDELSHLLDGMLDYAGNEKMLAMYKQVLRRYLRIYPQLVYDYVMIYRDMYELDDSKGGE